MRDDPSTLTNGFSDRVRAFYERHAYPAPPANLDRHVDLYRNPERRRALHHLVWPAKPLAGHQEILVAGCGTSQGATIALREPGSTVTAIDISETALRHVHRLQRQYDIRNLRIRHLPVERIHELGRRFDLIVATGVLHHLPDPDSGLRALRQALKRGGAMHLMVYAAYGRAGVYMMQEYCRLVRLQDSECELAELAGVLGRLPPEHPVAAAMRCTKDFRHPDALADALLHPVDRAFNVPQVYDWLERCGMSFGRWFEQAAYSPRCGVLATLPHAGRLCGLSPPLQHAAAELLRGTMTQHNFIAYRDDYPGQPQPVRFDSDHWHRYVPIRLPWTLCLRERVPAGCAAVLVNRAHGSPDLALPLDKLAGRVFRAIDGRRTVDDIVSAACGEGHRLRALGIVEQLWEYDQIVFDASRCPVATEEHGANGRPTASGSSRQAAGEKAG